MSRWEERRPFIQRFVNEGKTDEQIGMVFGVCGASICRVRKELNIPSQFSSRFRREAPEFFKEPETPVLVGETYIDGAGLTVTRYPARYAKDALIQSVTARPRR